MLDVPFARLRERFLPKIAPPLGALTLEQKRSFQENGFLVLPGLFSQETVEALRARLDRLWAARAQVADVAIDVNFGLPDAARLFFAKVDETARKRPYKLLDLHLVDDLVRDACTAPALAGAVKQLLGATPLVCNSLFFEWGSQQYPHFDTFFMPSETPNMMAASWIALDPVTEANGPVYYYPKSHVIPPYRFSHGKINAIFSELETGAAAHIDAIVAEHGLQKMYFTGKPGDVLIWHAQLLHGGSPIADPTQTRRSIVTHYWTEVDFPAPEQRIELGPDRWVLRKPHQYVIDDAVLAKVDAFLATIAMTAEAQAAVPAAFDARRYLARNQDVLAARADPWVHYIEHGRREGRIW